MEEGTALNLFYVGDKGQILIKDNSQIPHCGGGGQSNVTRISILDLLLHVYVRFYTMAFKAESASTSLCVVGVDTCPCLWSEPC